MGGSLSTENRSISSIFALFCFTHMTLVQELSFQFFLVVHWHLFHIHKDCCVLVFFVRTRCSICKMVTSLFFILQTKARFYLVPTINTAIVVSLFISCFEVILARLKEKYGNR